MKKPEVQLSEVGSGSPVVLLHGAPSAPEGFARVRERLVGSARVVTVTLPGYAPASAPNGEDEELVRYQESSLVEIAGRAKLLDAVWVGFSMGAERIFRLTSEGRLTPRAIVSLGGFLWVKPEAGKAMGELAAYLKTLPSMQNAPREQFARGMLAGPYADAHPEAIAEIISWIDATTPRVLGAELAYVAKRGPFDTGRLTMPIVARHGLLDTNVAPELSDEIAARCKNVKVEKVPNVAHALLIEDAEGTAESIRRVL